MKIAICDDEKEDLALLQSYCFQYDAALEVVPFLSAKSLLNAFEADFFDIVFMDIEMEHPNGFEAAELLRQREEKPLIVFTTQYLSYAVRGYGVAARYLPKPISYQMFCPVLQFAIKKVTPLKIKILSQGEEIVLRVSEIVYIEVLRHQVLFHRKSSDLPITSYGTLRDAMGKIEAPWFVQTHKSYCVNLDYVESIQAQEITLSTGEKIPLSRNRREQFYAQMNAYLKGGSERC